MGKIKKVAMYVFLKSYQIFVLYVYAQFGAWLLAQMFGGSERYYFMLLLAIGGVPLMLYRYKLRDEIKARANKLNKKLDEHANKLVKSLSTVVVITVNIPVIRTLANEKNKGKNI
ncbi:MAG: hypothetical protein WBK20_01590 [Spirochaetota bacterium]